MNMILKNTDRYKTVKKMLLILCGCTMLAGCNPIQDKIKEYSSDKEQCFLNKEDVTQFTYKENQYTILEDTVSNGNLGEWIGYIQQFAAVDEAGTVLLQEDVSSVSFHTIADLADKAPDAKYIIPFLNVYAAPNDASYLIVDANGGYHKAVMSNQVMATDAVFDYKVVAQETYGSFKLNPQNATQLICDDKIYQVTSETVSQEQLGRYLDMLAENVTFDVDTKIPLTKEELSEIDWNGDSSDKQRENRVYLEVYEISGIDTSEAIAVNVNQQYYVAKVK